MGRERVGEKGREKGRVGGREEEKERKGKGLKHMKDHRKITSNLL